MAWSNTATGLDDDIQKVAPRQKCDMRQEDIDIGYNEGIVCGML